MVGRIHSIETFGTVDVLSCSSRAARCDVHTATIPTHGS